MIDLRRLLYRAILAPLLLLAATALLLALQVRDLSVDARWVEHSDRVIAGAKDALGEIVDQETGFRAFLLTRDALFLESYRAVDPPRALGELVSLTADNPPQQRLLIDVRSRYEEWSAETNRVIAQPSEVDAAITPARMLLRKQTMDGIRAQFAELLRVEHDLRASREHATETATRRTYLMAIALLLFLATVLVFFTRKQLRDVAAMYETALAESRQKNDELLANQRFRELMLGILGHDLRNPISAISMASQLVLRRGGVNADGEKAIKRALASAARMDRMIEQLVDMTRARIGEGIRVTPREIDLVATCKHVVEESIAAHPDRRVELSGDDRAIGQWDADRLEQVVSNLVENAVSHGSVDGVVRVTVTAAGEDVTLTVHNDGAPIPADALPTLFDAFRRGGEAKSARARGLGLGLYIAQQIVGAHRGTIDVESTVERGTTFRVKLPRA